MSAMATVVVPATTQESKPEDSSIFTVIFPATFNSTEMPDEIIDMFSKEYNILIKKRYIPLKSFSSPTRPFRRSRLLKSSAAAFILLFSYLNATAQDDFLSEMQDDFLSIIDDTVEIDSLSTPGDAAQEKTLSTPGDMAQEKTLSTTVDITPGDSRPKKVSNEYKGLSNIVMEDKSIRAYGWGEYRVMGRCLCCDNALDGDCILVQNTNRTNRTRIKQIVDGNIEADTSNPKSYFGDVMERDNPKPVSVIMAEITFKNIRDIYEVIVYTMVDKEKKKNYLSSCELGYYDQFDRLQWAGKRESKWSDEYISFQLEKPILTKDVLLKIEGGKSRITEVTLLGKKIKQ